MCLLYIGQLMGVALYVEVGDQDVQFYLSLGDIVITVLTVSASRCAIDFMRIILVNEPFRFVFVLGFIIPDSVVMCFSAPIEKLLANPAIYRLSACPVDNLLFQHEISNPRGSCRSSPD